MVAGEQVERGVGVGKDIKERQDWVEEEEETYLKVVFQKAEDPRPE